MMPFANHPSAHALAWSLVHFAWQGSAIGLVALTLLRFSRLSASARYGVGVVALAIMMLAPVATFGMLAGRSAASGGAKMAVPTEAAHAALPIARAGVNRDQPLSSSRGRGALSPVTITALLAMWATGVAVLGARLLGGWIVARRWTRRVVGPASAEIQVMAARVAERLALDRVARVYESAAAGVPMVVGWVRPVILLPAAAMSGLAPAQLEALLAHELAHVRRHDYLVNLLQSVVETLLFYHPAVWWVSREVREAREHCCDDLAIAACGDRIAYASALTELATMMKPRLALAATDGSLTARVRRILGEPRDRYRRSVFWVPALLTLLLGAALVPMRAVSATPRSVPDVPMAVAASSQDLAVERAKAQAAAAEAELRKAQEQSLKRALEERTIGIEEIWRKAAVVQEGSQRARQQESAAPRQLEEIKALMAAMNVSPGNQQEASISKRQLAALEAKLRALELDTATAQDAAKRADRDRQLDEERRAIAAELQARGRRLSDVENLERKLQEMEKAVWDARAMYTEQHPRVVAANREYEALQTQYARLLEHGGGGPTLLYTAADEPIQVRDVLTIELRGDDGRYSLANITVSRDGIIELPVIGAVKVASQTLRQSEESLLKAAGTQPRFMNGKPVKSVTVTLVKRAN